MQFFIVSFFRSSALPVFLSAVFLFTLLPPEGQAQRKPLLRLMRRDHFAGKLAVLPHQAATRTYQLPRMLAQIADHDLLMPPRSLAGREIDAEGLMTWLRSVDLAETDGVIISPDLLLQGVSGTAQEWTEIIRRMRQERPAMPIYAYLTTEQPADAVISSATGLLMTGDLDYLLVPQKGLNESWLQQLTENRLTDRLGILTTADPAVSLLLTRQMLRRFGISPTVAQIFSREPVASINPAIQTAGLLPFEQGAARADILLFVHQPDTDEQRFRTFADNMVRAVGAGYRTALVDLSRAAGDRERLMNELRSHRMLDQLYAYAAADDESDGTALVLAQSAARLISAKFLRDDPERLRRVEQAQVEMLLNRWLKASLYDPVIRDQLDRLAREQWQADPDNLGSATQRAEEFVTDELRRLASPIFSELFRHNVHSVLMSSGERADFRVRAIQRIYAAFPYNRTADPEIRARVYLLPESITAARQTFSVWALRDPEKLDDRLNARYDETNWAIFDAGAGIVELRIDADDRSVAAPEGYEIRSTMKRQTRKIEISASTVQGAFYALARLEQLGSEGRLTEDLQISESPAFSVRGILEDFAALVWTHQDRLDHIRLLGRLRLNRFYYAPSDAARASLSDNQQSRLHSLLSAARDNFVELVYVLRPQLFTGDAEEDDSAALAGRIDGLIDAGVRHIALAFDNSPQSAATAHAALLRRAHAHLRGRLPEATLTLIHRHAQDDREYLRQLSAAIPPDVLLVLPAGETISEDAAARVRLYSHPAPGEHSSGTGIPAQFHPGPFVPVTQDEKATGIVLRPLRQAHAAMPALATMADYAWDQRRYKPQESLGRALQLLYDGRTREAMRLWSDAFDGRDAHAFAPLFTPQSEEINVPMLERKLTELRLALDGIGLTRERGLLRGELALVLRQIEKALAQLQNDPAYAKLPNGNYRRRAQ